jgi:hypothetical protein
MRFHKCGQKFHNAVGCILAVRVHHENGIASGILLKVCEADGNCSLVAKIAAQAQRSYRAHRGKAAPEIIALALLERAVVNEENLDATHVGNGSVKASDKF